LRGLPPRTISDCVIGFVERPQQGPQRNARDFILRHLGEGFAKHFMLPYNEKLFTVPCEDLSPEWGGRFIPRPTLEEVVGGAVGLARSDAGYNATFWYPREGGIEALARGVARDVTAKVRLRACVQRIDLRRRTVTLESGEELAYGRLVYTGPLSAAGRLAGVDAAAKLRAVSVTVVEAGGPDPGGERFHWAYFPEPRFPFYRIGSPSLVNPRLAPPGCRSFAVEFSHRGPADSSRMIAQAIAALAELGLLEDVRLVRARTIPVAYVLFDHDHAAARDATLRALAEGGVICAGRYGRWEYSSMEDALLSGREAARECSRS
jgi:protoporphyrinogen oxidase